MVTSRLDIPESDTVVIGSGPNGLSAAIVMAQAGSSVTVVEAAETIGGSARSGALTLTGFVHDLCSAVHPLAAGSPFFSTLPLGRYGLEWIHSPSPLAHPLDDGSAVVVERSVDETAKRLGRDANRYQELFTPMLRNWGTLSVDFLRPMGIPKDPFALVRFAWHAMRPAKTLATNRFSNEKSRTLFSGLAAHSTLPLEKRPSAAFGIVLGLAAHAVGWPIPRGGAQTDHQCPGRSPGKPGRPNLHRDAGGVDRSVASLACHSGRCHSAPAVANCGPRLPGFYRRKLGNYRYGPGAFKMDWALDRPVPWKSQDCFRAATIHLGGTREEIELSERLPWEGSVSERPFVLLAQPSLFDPSRAPEGGHTLWAYCHVPNGYGGDVSDKIEDQIERFAPGFRKSILKRSLTNPAQLEASNRNLVGGDINGGAATLSQCFFRPTIQMYATPLPGLYLCSSSTPPGGGVHGMCGYQAARLALKQRF